MRNHFSLTALAVSIPFLSSSMMTGSTNAFTAIATPSYSNSCCRAKTVRTKSPLLASSSSTSESSSGSGSSSVGRLCRARDLVKSLIEEEQCFTTDSGARAFGEVCAVNIVYEDCYEPQPFVGKTDVTKHMLEKVEQRQGKGGFRLDRITDGDKACGFAWTWTCGDEEGLRGTTFLELNDAGEIQYVREIAEPLFKPGDLTVEILKAVTADAEPKAPPKYEQRTPTIANEVTKYLFCEVQGGDIDESMRLFDESIVYRDFNYEDVLRGKDEVRKFIEDFSFPGITFRPQRFDDGQDSTALTWEVVLDGAPPDATTKGISFYALDPETRKVAYVRDVPEPAIKPAPLGKLARRFRPGLGVFRGVPLGSRPGGK